LPLPRNPQKVADAFPDASARLLAVPMDFALRGQISNAVQSALIQFGRIDVLVNNAGHGFIVAVEEASR